MSLSTLEGRKEHPFFMHEMIMDQAEAISQTLKRCEKDAVEITSNWKDASQFIFTGCGTSFHAALSASHFHQLFFQRNCNATESFELCEYYPKLDQNTLVTAFSHSGMTKTTIDALKKSKDHGAKTFALTGAEHSNLERQVDSIMVVGDGMEKSRAHTKSYTSALIASMFLTTSLGGLSSSLPNHEYKLSKVPELVRIALFLENEVKELAEDYFARGIKRYFFIGSGANIATGLEAALKMKESHYSYSEGMELEQFLHGPWVSLKPGDSLIVLIAPSGAAHGRNLDLLKACKTLGVQTLAITDDQGIIELATHSLIMREIEEALSPLTYILPLQLFAYYTAVVQNINPDYIHYDDPIYWAARQIIFPPGTH